MLKNETVERLLNEVTLPYFVKAAPDGSKRLAFYVDNHLISTFNFCETKFNIQHILRLRQKGPGGLAMNIGGWWSAVLEDFYNMIRMSQLATPQVLSYPTRNEFIEAAAKRWRESKMDELAVTKPKAYKDFGGAGGAALMAMTYYEYQGRLDAQQWKIIAAEKGFGQKGEVLLYEDDTVIIYYMGKPDLVVLADRGNTLLPVEHKTIYRIDTHIQSKYKPHPQIEGYVFSLNVIAKQLGYDKLVDRCVVNVSARATPAEKPRDGVKKPRFTRVLPHYSVEELEEWKQNVIGKVKRLSYSLLNDEWLRKDGPNTCHLYGGCEYRGICSVPPVTRPLVVKSDFVEIAPWAPYTIEEDEDEDV